MGHNLWRCHFRADEHPLTTYFDVHQGYRVLTHTHVGTNSFGLQVLVACDSASDRGTSSSTSPANAMWSSRSRRRRGGEARKKHFASRAEDLNITQMDCSRKSNKATHEYV